MAVDSEHMVKVANAYAQGFADGDAEAIIALYADDATVEDPIGTPAKQGIEAISEFYVGSVATGAKLELTGAVRTANNVMAFPFVVNYTPEGGEELRIEVIDVMEFNDQGKISSMKAYFGPENITPA